MVDLQCFRDLEPKDKSVTYTSQHVSYGIPIPAARRIELFSAQEFEAFTEEWALSLRPDYHSVKRFAGSGDQGLDVVAFISDDTFAGGWDGFQCKHYDHALYPSDVWVEIGKIIFYSYSREYSPPRKHYFVPSRGIGTTLAKYLASPDKLKTEAGKNWSTHCESGISESRSIELNGEFLGYFENFDFSIFSSKSVVELVSAHSRTPFHAVRFGGGLPCRPLAETPPDDIASTESRYIQQIFQAYTDHVGTSVVQLSDLSPRQDLQADFLRQRERFYHAESLRNFSRDTVPQGTFDALQQDVFHGVVDVCESAYLDGLCRMRATLGQSVQLSISASPLCSVITSMDKQGICHQLANEDRLLWVRNINDG
ncbi:MAG: ABC-three component system protein [Thermodesulfobacteriota bacterium]